MNARQAKRYINNSETIDREAFTWTFTQKTLHKRSAEKFREAVATLGGWIATDTKVTHYPNRKHHPHYCKRYYKIVAAIPKAIKN